MAVTLKDEKLPDRPIDPKIYVELGFQELTPDAKIPQQTIKADEPLNFFFKTKDGRTKTASLSVLKESATSFTVRLVQSEDHGWSTSTGGSIQSLSLDDGTSVTFAVAAPDSQGHYKVTTTIGKRSLM